MRAAWVVDASLARAVGVWVHILGASASLAMRGGRQGHAEGVGNVCGAPGELLCPHTALALPRCHRGKKVGFTRVARRGASGGRGYDNLNENLLPDACTYYPLKEWQRVVKLAAARTDVPAELGE